MHTTPKREEIADDSIGEPVIRIGPTPIYRLATRELRWTAGLQIDADGAPDAYGPKGTTPRDYLGNAGRPGNWWALVCVNGEPVVQGPSDPCPGYYVSTTALVDGSRAARDPRRYVDSARVPYLAVPPELRALGVRMGDVAEVAYRGQACAAICADVGPRGKIGEGSIALARALGIPDSPRHGGIGAGVSVRLWPGSGQGWPRTLDAIREQVEGLVRPVP